MNMDDKTEDLENQEETDDRDGLEDEGDRDDREYKIKLEIDDIMERVDGIMKKIETVYPSGKNESQTDS